MQKCSWPGCQREQNAPYCFPHGRGNTVKSNSKPQQPPSIPELIEKCQKVVNAFIRDRDRVKGCISCGGEVQEAGHYIAISENSALRFHEENLNGQCHHCNVFKRGNLVEYRKALIVKIGAENVMSLERYPKFHKYSRDQLQNIIEQYQFQAKK